MKFIDTFTEDDKKKLIKKAKLIYSVLKKGTITRSDGVKFSYELGDNMVPSVVDGEIYLFAFITKIIERTYCPINEIAMSDLIMKKFDQFDIKVDLQIPKSIEIVKYKGKKPWEEPINEEIDIDKERKRVKTIHKSLRKGIVNLSDGKYRYELPEDYTFHMVDDVLTQTSIKFTFYNHDLGPSFGGVGLPLRVWRIEEGKDVFINGILSNADVSDIVYGDEYQINSNSGVDYMNVKNKVKVRYHNFDINAIMTTPSDIIMVNEGEDRMIKRANTIFKAFRKGTIGPENDPNEPRFRYELSEDISISRNNVGVILFTDKIKITELNRACRHASVGYMADKIRNRFRDFGIILEHPHIDKEDVDTDLEREEELNEHAEVLNPESLTDKEIKKVKLVYKSFKKGHFVYDQLSTYGYELPDDYYIYKDELGDVCVKLDKKDTDTFYMFAKINSHEMELQPHHTGLHGWLKDRIIKKFDGFNIKFIF